VLGIALLCLLSLTLATGQTVPQRGGAEDGINSYEQNWAAVVTEGAASVDQ
jgi:hypothetical protein